MIAKLSVMALLLVVVVGVVFFNSAEEEKVVYHGSPIEVARNFKGNSALQHDCAAEYNSTSDDTISPSDIFQITSRAMESCLNVPIWRGPIDIMHKEINADDVPVIKKLACTEVISALANICPTCINLHI
ncbi:MAG: hypothetical protein HAW67_04700 [Endozoicomonadaceae bacterium]|nr:hypothetical protein [Endozoicomonadaceae bacterium]